MSSKMKGMVEQVLDEIMLEEGGDTEITVASVRKYWDDVHPKTAVPTPAVVRDSLVHLVEEGRIQPLAGGKSWVFTTPKEGASEAVSEAPAYNDCEWEELAPSPAPAKNMSAIAVRINPFGKVPTVVFRFRRDFVPAYRVRIFIGRNNRIAFKFSDSGGRRIGAYDKKSDSSLVTRLVGSQAEHLVSKLHGLRFPHTFDFDEADIKRDGELYVIKLEQEQYV